MIVKIGKHWVNPAHVVRVRTSPYGDSTEIRMSCEECNVEVPLPAFPVEKVVDILNAGDLTDAHIIARNALEDILRALDEYPGVDVGSIRSMARVGLGRLPV